MNILNKSHLILADEFIHTFIYGQNYSIADELFDDDCFGQLSFGLAFNRSMVVEKIKPWGDSFDIYKLEFCSKIRSNHSLIYQLQMVGKHIGDFKSMPATGKDIIINTEVILKMDGPKISQLVVSADVESIINQISAGKLTNQDTLNALCDNNSFDNVVYVLQHILKSKNIKITKKQTGNLCLWINGNGDSEMCNLLGLSKSGIHSAQGTLKTLFNCHSKDRLQAKIKALNIGALLLEGFLLLKLNSATSNKLMLNRKMNACLADLA